LISQRFARWYLKVFPRTLEKKWRRKKQDQFRMLSRTEQKLLFVLVKCNGSGGAAKNKKKCKIVNLFNLIQLTFERYKVTCD
jgi:hypothetical protein